MTLNHESIGVAMRERREDLGIIQPEIVQEMRAQGFKASQSRLSDVERGFADFVVYWPTPQARIAALKAYGFNTEEIRALNRRHLLGLDQVLLPEGARPVVASSAGRIDHVGVVSAGNGGSGVLVSKKKVSAPDWIADTFDLDFIFAADVEGSSMTCSDVAKTIPAGATAFFHRPSSKVQPRKGDIVYAYLPSHDQSVIKLFEPDKGHTLLTSYNEQEQPIVLNESNPGEVQGVYLGHAMKAKRFR